MARTGGNRCRHASGRLGCSGPTPADPICQNQQKWRRQGTPYLRLCRSRSTKNKTAIGSRGWINAALTRRYRARRVRSRGRPHRAPLFPGTPALARCVPHNPCALRERRDQRLTTRPAQLRCGRRGRPRRDGRSIPPICRDRSPKGAASPAFAAMKQLSASRSIGLSSGAFAPKSCHSPRARYRSAVTLAEVSRAAGQQFDTAENLRTGPTDPHGADPRPPSDDFLCQLRSA